jgi:hypothetical protein
VTSVSLYVCAVTSVSLYVCAVTSVSLLTAHQKHKPHATSAYLLLGSGLLQ